jgi:uncharacterized protein YhdP
MALSNHGTCSSCGASDVCTLNNPANGRVVIYCRSCGGLTDPLSGLVLHAPEVAIKGANGPNLGAVEIKVSHQSKEETFEVIEYGQAGARITARIPYGASDEEARRIIDARVRDLSYTRAVMAEAGFAPSIKVPNGAKKMEATAGGD